MAFQYGTFLSYPLVVGVDYNDMTDGQMKIMTNLSIGYKACSAVLIFLDTISAVLLLISMQRIYKTIK